MTEVARRLLDRLRTRPEREQLDSHDLRAALTLALEVIALRRDLGELVGIVEQIDDAVDKLVGAGQVPDHVINRLKVEVARLETLGKVKAA